VSCQSVTRFVGNRKVVWQGSAGDRRPYADQKVIGKLIDPELAPLSDSMVSYSRIVALESDYVHTYNANLR
jgi:hypothetical protein